MIEGAVRRWLTLLGAAALGTAVCLVVLAFGGAIPAVNPLGLDPGRTPWLLPLARLAMDGAAVATVGCLLAAVFLVPGEYEEHRLVVGPAARHWLHLASWSAIGWAVAAAASGALTLSDLLGVPVGDATTLDNLYVLVTQIATGKALTTVFALALLVATGSQFVRTVSGAALVALVAVAAVLPPTFTGHSAASASHELATSAMMLHVLGAVVWAGGLVALALVRRLPADALAKAVARFSGLALACIAVVAVSGVISALVRVNSVADVFTRYGVLLAGKLLALLVLAGLGAWHRRATLPALAAGRPGRFVRVASVEIGVLAATFGLAAGLARTPPPSKLRIDELLEIPLRRAMEWLPDLVFLTLAVAAVAGYLVGLRRLRGHRWPVSRTAAWIAGWALVVLASDLQLARTGAGMFGLTDRLQHLTIGTAAPLLLAAGRGATVARLALRPAGEPGMRGPAEWLAALGESRVARAVRHPVGTVLLAAAGVYVLYLGVQYSFALTTHAAHLAVLAGALVAGLLVAERLLDAGLREPVRLTLGAAVLALTALLVLVFTVSAALPSSLSDDPGRAVPPTMFTGQWLVVTALCVLAVWVACAATAPPSRPAAPEPRGLADTDVKDSSIPAQRADAQTPNMPRRSATGAERAP